LSEETVARLDEWMLGPEAEGTIEFPGDTNRAGGKKIKMAQAVPPNDNGKTEPRESEKTLPNNEKNKPRIQNGGSQ